MNVPRTPLLRIRVLWYICTYICKRVYTYVHGVQSGWPPVARRLIAPARVRQADAPRKVACNLAPTLSRLLTLYKATLFSRICARQFRQ
jgi:hypothetical protein